MAQHFLSYALSVFDGIFMTCNVCALQCTMLGCSVTAELKIQNEVAVAYIRY
jgi:hypothetical protein